MLLAFAENFHRNVAKTKYKSVLLSRASSVCHNCELKSRNITLVTKASTSVIYTYIEWLIGNSVLLMTSGDLFSFFFNNFFALCDNKK